MKSYFMNADGKSILLKMVTDIQNGKEYLSDIDGLIGDGDHGMNMNKGFTVFKKRFGNSEFSFSEGLEELGMILLNEIGGSMGPIYSSIFIGMHDYIEENKISKIGLSQFEGALEAGLNGLLSIVDARVGDKTLVDTLAPAVECLKKELDTNDSFETALYHMKEAALKGSEGTKDMIAKYGRSARLGQRSIGVIDAGSCSCKIILDALADGIIELLK